MILRCAGLAPECQHDGVTLYWCDACRSHGCACALPWARNGLPPEAFPPRWPRLDSRVWMVVQQGRQSYFVSAMASVAVPANVRLVAWGLN